MAYNFLVVIIISLQSRNIYYIIDNYDCSFVHARVILVSYDDDNLSGEIVIIWPFGPEIYFASSYFVYRCFTGIFRPKIIFREMSTYNHISCIFRYYSIVIDVVVFNIARFTNDRTVLLFWFAPNYTIGETRVYRFCYNILPTLFKVKLVKYGIILRSR